MLVKCLIEDIPYTFYNMYCTICNPTGKDFMYVRMKDKSFPLYCKEKDIFSSNGVQKDNSSEDEPLRNLTISRVEVDDIGLKSCEEFMVFLATTSDIKYSKPHQCHVNGFMKSFRHLSSTKKFTLLLISLVKR